MFCFQEKEPEEVSANPNNLTQFRIKKDMRMAPRLRVSVSLEMLKTLDKFLTSEKPVSKDQLYKAELENKKRKPMKSERTWPPGNFQFDI
jgi:hypothetical protein